jgi:stearoyl-CoA desaturase (delta-9 desaturase)
MPMSHVLIAVATAFVVAQVAITVTTVYLHRGLAHRALTVREPAALPFRVFIWMTTGMRPREWVAVHRKPDDPHSPLQVGFWRVQLGNVGLYRRCAADEENIRKYARDLPPDRLDKIFFDHSLFGLGVGIAIIVSVSSLLGYGPLTGLLAAGLHAVFYVMLSGAINAVGHQFGKQPYENSATNLRPLALITGGEGLHNNHHAAPTSARFALHRGEVDPGWWLVRALVAMHLAQVRHERVHLKSAA